MSAISVRDPEFAARAARVLDLYAGIWDGRAQVGGAKVGANVHIHRATSGNVWRALSQADGIPGHVRLRPELVTSPERIVGGRMARPSAPGLGAELIEKELVKHRPDHFIREIPGYYEPDFTIT